MSSGPIEIASTVVSIGVSTQNLGRDIVKEMRGVGASFGKIGQEGGASFASQFSKASSGATKSAQADQEKLAAAVQSATGKVKNARDSEAAAARKVAIEEAKLKDLRDKGASNSQILTAEDRLASARTKQALATARTTTEVDKLKDAQRELKVSSEQASKAVGQTGHNIGKVFTGKGENLNPFRQLPGQARKAGDESTQQIGKAFGKIPGQAGKAGNDAGDKMQKGIGGKLKGGLSGIGSMLKLGLAGAAAGAGAAVGAAFTSAISKASNLEQSIGGVGAVFGKDAAQIDKAAREAARSMGMSRNAYNELATTVGAGLKNKGIVDYADQTQRLLGLGSDLAAQFGGSTQEAVEALSSLMRGEADPIERYGVSINETAVSAELAARGQDKLTGAALESAKAQARLDLVFRQTKDAQGAFARESDTFAGKQARAAAQWEDLQAKIGTAFLPILTKAMGFVSDVAIPALEGLGKGIQGVWSIISQGDFKGGSLTFGLDEDSPVVDILFRIRDAFTAVRDAAAPVVRDIAAAFREFIEKHAPAFRKVWEVLGLGQIKLVAAQVKMLAEGFAALWRWFGDDIIRIVTGSLGAVVDAVAALVDGVVAGVGVVGALLRGDWSAAWDGMKGVAQSGIDTVTALVAGWGKVLEPVLEPVGRAWQATWDAALKPVWDGMRGYWDANMAPLLDRMGSAWQGVWRDKVQPAWSDMKSGWESDLRGTWAGMQSYWDETMAPMLGRMGDAWASTWRDDIKPGWDDFKARWNDTLKASWDDIKRQWDESLAPAVRDVSTQWRAMWYDNVKPLWDDLKRVWNDTLKPAWADIKRQWDEQLKPAVDQFRDTWDAVWNRTVKPVWDDIKAKWNDTLKPPLDQIETTANEFSGNKGGSGSGPKFGTAWDLLGKAISIGASVIVTALTGLITIINAVVTALSFLLGSWNSTWSQMEGVVKTSVEFIVNTVYDEGLKPAFNKIAESLGMSFRLPAMRVSFSPPNTMFAGGGSAQMGQFDTGGWTGPGEKYQIAGVVHADEFVINKQARGQFEAKFPGYLKYINDTGTLPGYAEGGRVHPVPGYGVNWRRGYHGVDRGLDIPAPQGTPVVAMRDASVVSTPRLSTSYGWHVRTSDGAVYAHLSRIDVQPGQQVRAGQRLGLVGSTGNSTGPHLHVVGYDGSAAVGVAGAVQSLTDFVSQFTDGIAGTMGKLNELGGSPWAEMMKQIPAKIVEGATGKIKEAVESMLSATDSISMSGGTAGAGWQSNANLLMQAGKALGASRQAMKIALMTAAQESSMGTNRSAMYSINRDGDVGWFQQRATRGDGTVAQLADPLYALRVFLYGKKVPAGYHVPGLYNKNWQSMGLGQAAQAVQVSAFPRAYDKWEDEAEAWLNAYKYDSGGWLPPGVTMARNETGKPEAILTAEQWQALMSGRSMPEELVVVDADGALIGRMRVEAQSALADSYARVGGR